MVEPRPTIDRNYLEPRIFINVDTAYFKTKPEKKV